MAAATFMYLLHDIAFGRIIIAGIASITAMAALAELPSNDGGSPVVVIDLHTHVFNARDLPLAGAINAMSRSWVSQPVAELLKKALLALTSADDLEGPFPPEGKPTEGSALLSLDAKRFQSHEGDSGLVFGLERSLSHLHETNGL
jgi:hypothetical protein